MSNLNSKKEHFNEKNNGLKKCKAILCSTGTVVGYGIAFKLDGKQEIKYKVKEAIDKAYKELIETIEKE